MAELSGNIQLQQAASQPRSFSPASFAAPQSHSESELSLNEPVLTTIARDLKRIGTKLWQVIVPVSKSRDPASLREWDLWGPLLFTFILAVTLTVSSNEDSNEADASYVFSVVFVLVVVGAVMITMNALLLGGKVSFFQSVSIMGYCVFPMDVVALLIALAGIPAPFKEILVGLGMAWSTYASLGFIGQLVPDDRRALAVYPVLLFYLFLSWFIIALA